MNLLIREDVFKTIIYRPLQANTGEVSGEVKKLISVLNNEMKRLEIQKAIDLKHEDYSRANYLLPAINEGYIELTYPNSPNHPQQKYRLTSKGKNLRDLLIKKKKK